MRYLLLVTLALLLTGGSGGGTAEPFDPSVTVNSTVTLKTGGSPDWHGRAAIKRRPSDNALVMVYRSGTSHLSASSRLHIRFSDDDGATWTADDTTLGGGAVTGFPLEPPEGEINAGDGWLYVAPNGDLLLHLWSVVGDDWPSTLNGTWQTRSTDGGETWDTPVQVDFGGGLDQDKTFSTDDDFVWDRVIYAGARVYNANTPTNSYVVFVKSTDNGATWEYVSDITSVGSDTQEVGLEYVGNSTIIGMVRSLNNDETLQAVSTDMGATWTLTDVSGTVGVSGRHRIYTRSHLQGLGGWWKDPVLFMVGFISPSPGDSQPRRNCIWVSPDRGVTWDGPHYIDSQTDDAGYGDLFYDSTNDRYVVVSYQGTLSAAALKQYNLTVSGLH